MSQNKKTGHRPKNKKKPTRFNRKKPNFDRNRAPQKKIILPKTFDIDFYSTLSEAERNLESISAKAKLVDQFNMVIEAEDPVDLNSPLIEHGVVYCGNAWTIIHRRRVEDGWYSERSPAPKTSIENSTN